VTGWWVVLVGYAVAALVWGFYVVRANRGKDPRG
jgi:hypothetical protein